jgi:hypothetical protein
MWSIERAYSSMNTGSKLPASTRSCGVCCASPRIRARACIGLSVGSAMQRLPGGTLSGSWMGLVLTVQVLWSSATRTTSKKVGIVVWSYTAAARPSPG